MIASRDSALEIDQRVLAVLADQAKIPVAGEAPGVQAPDRQHGIDAFQIDGFDQKVIRAQLHRLHGVLHRSVGRQHDDQRDEGDLDESV